MYHASDGGGSVLLWFSCVLHPLSFVSFFLFFLKLFFAIYCAFIAEGHPRIPRLRVRVAETKRKRERERERETDREMEKEIDSEIARERERER